MTERGRLLNVVRYIVAQFPDGIEFSKLSNLIYLADGQSYAYLHRSVSGARHVARSWGVEVVGLRRACAYLRRRGELRSGITA